MILDTIVVGPLHTNCYLYGDKQTGEICIIDPGGNADRILRRIAEKNYSAKYILLTHGHFDHIGAVRDILEKLNIPLYVHKDEAPLLQEHLTAYLQMDFAFLSGAMHLIEEGDTFAMGSLALEAIQTPGHTAGGVCYRGDGVLFAGDTIFYENIGRADLPTGNYSALIASVNRVLTMLPEDTEIYSGHGEKTTVAHEKAYNPYFSHGDRI